MGKMNLVADIGNSCAKLVVFDGDEVAGRFSTENLGTADLERLSADFPDLKRAILASTRGPMAEVEGWLERRMELFVRQSPDTPVPIKNSYRTPETLGQDRLAAAVGAHWLMPDRNVMIADFGTAITVDVVTTEGEYLGGNILPGVWCRFRSLHEFTANLPMCDFTESYPLLGGTTTEAIVSGVLNGVVFEMEGYMERLNRRFENLSVIFTGGDAKFFVDRLKNTIFANYDLVTIGLNRILEHNAG